MIVYLVVNASEKLVLGRCSYGQEGEKGAYHDHIPPRRKWMALTQSPE
jgi:hypothetical protein